MKNLLNNYLFSLLLLSKLRPFNSSSLNMNTYKFIPKNKNNSRYFHNTSVYIPFKLPMISESKPYKLSKNNEIILGGYLNNDNFTEDRLFIKKAGYIDKRTLMSNNNIINLINGVSKVKYKINQNTLDFI